MIKKVLFLAFTLSLSVTAQVTYVGQNMLNKDRPCLLKIERKNSNQKTNHFAYVTDESIAMRRELGPFPLRRSRKAPRTYVSKFKKDHVYNELNIILDSHLTPLHYNFRRKLKPSHYGVGYEKIYCRNLRKR